MVRHKLLGINVDIMDEEETFERILTLSELDFASQVILLDSQLIIKAKFNKELAKIINSANLVIPISKTVTNGLSFVSKVKATSTDKYKFIIRLFSFLEDYHKIIYMLGGGKKMIQKAEKNIKDSFPGLHLMGAYHIRYKKDFEKKLMTNIKKISPSVLLVSMSRPKQEKWIYKNSKSLKTGVCIGVENFVDYVGEKDLSPFDKIKHEIALNFVKLLKKPAKSFNSFIYIILLIIYKIFKLDRKKIE